MYNIQEKNIHEYINARLKKVSAGLEDAKSRFNQYAIVTAETENSNAWETHKNYLKSWENYQGRVEALEKLAKKDTAYAIACSINNDYNDATYRAISDFKRGFLDELGRALYVISNLHIFEASEIQLIEP